MTSESQIARIDPPMINEEDSASNAYDSLVQTQNALSSIRQDIARLPSVIEHLQENIARLQADLACQNSDLARCLTQEQHLLRDVEKHRQTVEAYSYIGVLPDEILVHVFLLLVQTSDCRSVGPSGGHFYPWRIAAVCQRWRTICMDTPTLWACIWWHKLIHRCQDRVETGLLYDSRISMQLERSKAAPLFVRCRISCTCPTAMSTIRAMVAHAHRWKKVDIDLGETQSIQTLRSIIPPGTAFTSLEVLVWDAHYKHLDIPYADYGPLEGLRHVELRGLKDLPLDTKIPWDHLISLEIGYWSSNVRDVLSVLPHCQALHTLHLYTYVYDSDDPVGNIDIEKGSISLPHVTEADFFCGDFSSSSSCIPYIRCPSLQKLTTAMLYDKDSSQALADFIVRSQCQELLEDLTIACEDFSKIVAYISPLLRACAAIESLSITCWSSAEDEFISSLILQREAPDSWLCPRLRRLELDGPNPDITLAMQMINSRLNVPQPAASLKYVRWVRKGEDKSAVTIRRSILENSYSFQDISFEFT